MEYYNQLEQFLAQAKTDNLKTKHFESEFKETKVKVSFGQGNTAKIPWISFLKEPNTTSNGIYPVYLYYKDYDLLILAYGISETNKPQKKWDIRNKETINDYFKKNFGEKPDRYGNSFVFKIYDLKEELNKQQVEKDLELILSEYTKINFDDFEPYKKKLNGINSFDIQSFQNTCKTAGLVYTDILITRFVSSLLTKPFVILTGLSGSGKTKLAQAYVQWICQEESQYRIIPVGADWTNREPLLGYPNALKPEEYVKPDSGVIDLILQANSNPKLPHFLILDEMNLSHVERYFADFLSVMESNEEIPLYAEGTVDNGVPAKLKVPSNLFIIGTVNIDETTNMFSPKVLDRANTIEFRVSKIEMESFLGNIKDLNMDALMSKGATMSKAFLDMAAKKSFATVDIKEINQTLIKFFGELTKTGAEFGYRSATEILRLIHQLSEIDAGLTTNEKIDIAIMQKLLPKLHGSRRKLTPILETLGSFCVSKDLKIVEAVFEKDDFEYYKEVDEKLIPADDVLYPLSLEKIKRMYKGAIENGFASYAEA
jgi:5-methylcytosine-specific restriction protein B